MYHMTKVNQNIKFDLADAQKALAKAMDHYSKDSRKRKALLKIDQAIDEFVCTLPIDDGGDDDGVTKE